MTRPLWNDGDQVTQADFDSLRARIADLEDVAVASVDSLAAAERRVTELDALNATLQERNFRYLSALTDIGEQDENTLCYLPTAHLKGQRARKAIH